MWYFESDSRYQLSFFSISMISFEGSLLVSSSYSSSQTLSRSYLFALLSSSQILFIACRRAQLASRASKEAVCPPLTEVIRYLSLQFQAGAAELSSSIDCSQMYELNQLYEGNSQRRTVDLQLRNIKDLSPLVSLLSKFRMLTDLKLHGNRLYFLPNLGSFKLLRSLDVSNNPLKIDDALLDRLFCIPNLEQLSIDANQEETLRLIESLPKLKILNDKGISRTVVQQNTVEEELAIQAGKLKEEMERIKQIYDKLTKILEENKQSRSNEEQFMFLYRDIVEEFNYFYSGLQDNVSREGVFIYCKNKLTSILDNHLLRLLEQNGLDGLMKTVETINKVKQENFQYMLRTIFSTSYKLYVEDEMQKPSNQLRKEKLYQHEILRLKHETIELRKQNKKIDYIASQEKEIIKAIGTPKSTSKSKSSFKTNKLSKSISKQTIQVPSPIKQLQNSKQQNNNPKAISLDQLLTLIEEIMREKTKFNIRCLSKKERFETAEEFLFTYYSRRYGLKEISLEWALCTIKAIQTYSKDRMEVEIFGKILKNQLYEQYYDQFKQFDEVVKQVLREVKTGQSGQMGAQGFSRAFFQIFTQQQNEVYEKIISKIKFPLSSAGAARILHTHKLLFEEKHMKEFITAFNRLDANDDGSLTANETRQLIEQVLGWKSNLQEGELKKLKLSLRSQIDALKKDKFIFSEVFQLVQQHL